MAKKKKLPKGQINKTKINLKRFQNLMKDLGRDVSVKVGIIGEQGSKKHPDSDLTMADLGAIHEFGATIKATDKLRGFFYHHFGIQKSKDPIVIPARSFLRASLLTREGKKVLRKAVGDQLSTDREFNKAVGEADSNLLTDIANILGLTAIKRVQEAFASSGFGQWAPITEFTKQHRIGDPDNPPLDSTGDLKDSVWYEVKEKK